MNVSTRSWYKWPTTSFLLSFVLTTVLVAGPLAPRPPHAASTFTNPISPTPDPFIIAYQGSYYPRSTVYLEQ